VTTTPVAPDLDASLSTQPAAPPPLPPPGPRRQRLAAVRRTWRQLTSMRTALLLLFLLALAAVPGSFLPQRSINPIRVDEYFTLHPALAPVLDRVQAFDVFGSPWFAAVYLLLFVSLVGCLGPRIRLHARALRTPPPRVPATLSRLPASAQWETRADPEQVVEAARRTLRAGRWRTVRRETHAGSELSAEKGYLRESGNLVFHVALVGLLVGIAVGGLYGFKGTVLVKEGDGFANAVFNFDDIRPGRRFVETSLVPLHFTLDDFRATYGPEGKARTFDADVRWAGGPDAALRPYDMRVNHPLHVGAAKVYLLGHGYAPRVEVRDARGAVALSASDAVACLPQDAAFLSNCAVKVPDARPGQLAFQGVFTPTTVQDPATGRIGSAYPAAADPALTVVGFRGDVGLDAGIPGSVYRLDKSRLSPVDGGRAHELRVGETWALPGGGSIRLVGVEEWATFQVTQDPGKGIALGAGIAMIGGLMLSLFVRRRRVWVRATPAGGDGAERRTVVHVGGLARTDTERFTAEFDELLARLRDPTTPHPTTPHPTTPDPRTKDAP